MFNLSRLRRVARCAMAAMLAVAGSSAMAAGTWNFGDITVGGSLVKGCNSTATNQATTNANNFGNSWNCGATTGSGSVTVSAWGSQTVSGVATYQTALLSNQGTSGFGVASRDEGLGATSPNHAADNAPGTSGVVDMVLLKFNSAVILDKVTLGWWQSDNDISVMAYTGSSAPTTFVQGKNGTNLTTATSGWQAIETKGDVDPTGSAAAAANSTDVLYTVNTGSVASSYWLISAYNAGFGGAAKDGLADYVKLFSVATRDAAQVAEPGSLLLVSLALFGGWRVRRRQVGKA